MLSIRTVLFLNSMLINKTICSNQSNPQTLFLSTVITLFMYCFTCCFYRSVVSIASCSPIVSCTITAFCTFTRCCTLLPLSPYECYMTYNTVLTLLFNFYCYCKAIKIGTFNISLYPNG